MEKIDITKIQQIQQAALAINNINPEILKNILVPMQNNRDAKDIIQSQIRKSKTLKIIHF